MSPPAPPTAAPPASTAVEIAATRAAGLALAILAWSLLASATGLPSLPVATVLALSIGLSTGLLVLLQQRRSLCALWAELTTLIAAAYLAASAWNGLVATAPSLRGGLDLLFGALLWWQSWGLARAARAANAGT
jgi:hypothetical protein